MHCLALTGYQVNNKELYQQRLSYLVGMPSSPSFPKPCSQRSGFIHAVAVMVIRSISTAVIKQISKKFHLKSTSKIGVGRNIMHLGVGGRKVWILLSSGVDMIALQNVASPRNESLLFPSMLHLQ